MLKPQQTFYISTHNLSIAKVHKIALGIGYDKRGFFLIEYLIVKKGYHFDASDKILIMIKQLISKRLKND